MDPTREDDLVTLENAISELSNVSKRRKARQALVRVTTPPKQPAPSWRVNADNSDPDRTHQAITRYARYGLQGHVERGAQALMRQAQLSTTDCSLGVQAIGLFCDVQAALRVAGIDPEGPWGTALAHKVGL